jgi:hypothetical protein
MSHVGGEGVQSVQKFIVTHNVRDFRAVFSEYLHGDYLMLYTASETDATVYLLSIRYHRELSFDFSRLWPRA